MTRIDLTGELYGRILITAEGSKKGKERYWKGICQCKDKTVVEIRQGNLRNGTTTSCGCRRKEVAKAGGLKHGMGTTRVYKVWQNIKDRCHNPGSKRYADYGGRGIVVCRRWLDSFENFYQDMGDTPKSMTLEREDNNAGYSKENCRWATYKEQARNRRNNRMICHNDEVKCLAEWAEDRGLTYSALYGRLERGWSVARSLETPARCRAEGVS